MTRREKIARVIAPEAWESLDKMSIEQMTTDAGFLIAKACAQSEEAADRLLQAFDINPLPKPPEE